MISGTIASIRPYGRQSAHPGVMGLIRVNDGTFLVWHSSQLTVVPGGPRLRLDAPCTADPSGPYALNVQLTSPIPFP